MHPAFQLRRLFNDFIGLTVMLAIISLTISYRSATAVSDRAGEAITSTAKDKAGESGRHDSRVAENVIENKRTPLILLYEYNPWAMVLGSDSPTFALYDDGLVIFARSNEAGRYEYASLVLSERERDEFLAALPIKQFNELKHEYELDLMTDQPTTVLSVGDRTGLKGVRVYGNLQRPARDGDPQPFMQIYRKLKSFNDTRAARWMPEKVELMIWPYENAGTPLPWPKDWPDTTHPTTKKRGASKDSINCSIYLTPAQYEGLKKRLEAKSADALLINRRKWAFSFRFPFPNEDSWRKKAFDS